MQLTHEFSDAFFCQQHTTFFLEFPPVEFLPFAIISLFKILLCSEWTDWGKGVEDVDVGNDGDAAWLSEDEVLLFVKV